MAPTSEPLKYIQRTQRYYQALGYEKPYQWAHFDTVPFTAPTKPLSECIAGIVCTAAPYHPDKGNQGPKAPYNAAAKFSSVYRLPIDPSPDLRISHIAIDRDHTTAEDSASFFPLAALKHAWQKGQIGGLASYVYGLPTNRSQNHTLNVDSQDLLKFIIADKVDVVILVPNCPVCHQSVSLAARTLEEAGCPTVILGCAKDIVEHVGVPRLLFSDLPLGNAAGIPWDSSGQQEIIKSALDLVSTATSARTTKQTPFVWPGKSNWKNDYSNPDHLSVEEIQRRRTAFELAKTVAKSST